MLLLNTFRSSLTSYGLQLLESTTLELAIWKGSHAEIVKASRGGKGLAALRRLARGADGVGDERMEAVGWYVRLAGRVEAATTTPAFLLA